MSPEDTHKPIRIYIRGLILGVNTLYMFILHDSFLFLFLHNSYERQRIEAPCLISNNSRGIILVFHVGVIIHSYALYGHYRYRHYVILMQSKNKLLEIT